MHINDLIDSLKISDKLKREFKAFNFMYHNNYSDGILRQPYFWKQSPEYKELEKAGLLDLIKNKHNKLFEYG